MGAVLSLVNLSTGLAHRASNVKGYLSKKKYHVNPTQNAPTASTNHHSLSIYHPTLRRRPLYHTTHLKGD